MDKPQHPQVIRTWTVARIKAPLRPAQPVKPQRYMDRAKAKRS